VEETPEVVLARLERYADSLRRGNGRAPAVKFNGTAAPAPALRGAAAKPASKAAYVAVAPSAAPTDQFIPVEVEEQPSLKRPLIESAAQLIAVLVCVALIIVFIAFGPIAGNAVAVPLAIGGVVGMKQRWPVSGWFTLGVVVALALGNLS
jgi:hypothetical protein